MKKHITLIVAVFLTASLWAQSPEKMSYQAVVRNASDALVTNKAVGMKVSILKGSATGTAVYVETHKPTTNANGLVSVSIGGGTVVSGAFADIDWASGAFFLKTETDPAGGTSYSITGISQLLSVPYALHAKTAESVTGTITETDPVYAASQAKNITAAHIMNLGKLSGTNTGDQDISGIAANTATINNLTAKLVVLLNLQILSGASVADLLAAGASVADLIGLNYQGGKIAYILQSGDPGYDANVAHGIIAAPIDQSTGIQWYNGSYTVTGATATALGTGNENTNTIVTSQGPGSYAAKLCADLVLGGYSDWYLPSKDELNKLYLNRVTVGGFEFGFYSSSTESSSTYVWLHNIVEGGQYQDLKDFPDRVRCVRAF